MSVSVIVTTYNSEKFISESIESVLNQTYQDFEIIVVDDFSTDTTKLIIEKFIVKDNRIKWHQFKNNFGGPAWGRNYGIKNAKYNLVAFLDSDDIWHNQKLEIQIKFLNKKNISFVSSEKLSFKNTFDSNFRRLSYSDISFDEIDIEKILEKNYIVNSSTLIKKNLLNDFIEKSEFIAVEDAFQWMNILKDGFICYNLKPPLVFYRISDTSISNNKLKMFKKRFFLLKKFRYNNNSKINFFKKILFLTKYVYLSLKNRSNV